MRTQKRGRQPGYAWHSRNVRVVSHHFDSSQKRFITSLSAGKLTVTRRVSEANGRGTLTPGQYSEYRALTSEVAMFYEHLWWLIEDQKYLPLNLLTKRLLSRGFNRFVSLPKWRRGDLTKLYNMIYVVM